jgi:hypothetical protein
MYSFQRFCTKIISVNQVKMPLCSSKTQKQRFCMNKAINGDIYCNTHTKMENNNIELMLNRYFKEFIRNSKNIKK